MSGIVAVHLGAGLHRSEQFKQFNALSKTACRAGVNVLKSGGTAAEAVKAAIIQLEDDPLTNAGYGSNLTVNGYVEGDASIMDGKSLGFGGCGAVKSVKNPIELAYNLYKKQFETLPLGLIPPCMLVGEGALEYAKTEGIKTVSNKTLVSPRALRQLRKYKPMLDLEKSVRFKVLDTVGAVCIDDTGHVAAACSSGGLLLKKPGRVGQAALYASGVWADSFTKDTDGVCAVCTTGTGEHLVQTQLAREIAEDLKSCSCPTMGLYKTMTDKFMNSKYLHTVESKLGGALVLKLSNEGEGAVLWGHSTESMSVGYMKASDRKATSVMSQLPENIMAGTKVNVGAVHFYL